MRNFLILAISSLLVGCADWKQFPEFPSKIKFEYALLKHKEEFFCAQFPIVSISPYKLGKGEEVPMAYCEGLTGFLPEDRLKLTNWITDVQSWAKDRTCKLK